MYSYANGTHLVGLSFRINVDLGCKEAAIGLQKSHQIQNIYTYTATTNRIRYHTNSIWKKIISFWKIPYNKLIDYHNLFRFVSSIT